jgi:hypothetical protein
VDPTQWKHDPQDVDKERTLDVIARFHAEPIRRQLITVGPLQEVQLPDEGPVVGELSWWPDQVLLNNGRLTNDQFSEFTSILDGTSHNKFIPRSECRYQGVGSIVTQVGTVEVVFLDEIYSMVPPNKLIGWISKRAEIKVEVSHHTGQAGPAAADVSAEAFTSLDDLPCQWTGTGHVEGHEPDPLLSRNYTADATFTVDSPYRYSDNIVLYLTSGEQATWHLSGVAQGSVGQEDIFCPYERSGTSNVSGSLAITDHGGGQLTYSLSGSADLSWVAPVECGEGLPKSVGDLVWAAGGGICDLPLTGDTITGGCSNGDYGANYTYSWTFTAVSCTGTAAVVSEGTCGAVTK